MKLEEAIEQRRSVRRFSPEPVPDEDLTAMLKAACWAPSWANTQVWEFIVVRDRELIEGVTETYAEKNPATKCSLGASALIVACAKVGVSGCHQGQDLTKFSNWFMFDLGLAVQNLCLKAHALGLGTVVVGLMDHDACRRRLDLPEGYEVVCVIPVGWPATGAKAGPGRKDLADCVHLNRFGRPFLP